MRVVRKEYSGIVAPSFPAIDNPETRIIFVSKSELGGLTRGNCCAIFTLSSRSPSLFSCRRLKRSLCNHRDRSNPLLDLPRPLLSITKPGTDTGVKLFIREIAKDGSIAMTLRSTLIFQGTPMFQVPPRANDHPLAFRQGLFVKVAYRSA